MATLKGTISDSDEEAPNMKKRDKKASKKQRGEDDEQIKLDSHFTMIDDSLRKDVSLINKKKEYEGNIMGGNKWSYAKNVTEDVSQKQRS